MLLTLLRPALPTTLQVDVTNRTEGRAYTDSNGVPVLVHYDDRCVAIWGSKANMALAVLYR